MNGSRDAKRHDRVPGAWAKRLTEGIELTTPAIVGACLAFPVGIFVPVVGVGFIILAVVGFRGSLWVVAAALGMHGVFDPLHGSFIANPGVPRWWPAFCLTYAVVAAVYLARLIRHRRTPARA